MNQFDEVSLSDKIKDSLPKLLNRDTTAVTLSAGTSFPTDITSDMVGRLCNRTDLRCIYTLSAVNPITWTLVLDYSSTPALQSYVAANYQPLNAKLTTFSNVATGTDKVPYFLNTDGQMSTFTITTFGKSLLNSASASATRTLLGLGSLATKSTVSNSDITSQTITTDKLAFTPVTTDDTFQTGDIKETFSSTTPTGWIELTGSIGSASSGATYANAAAENLFLLLWTKSGITVQPSKGSTAAADWSGNKKIVFPTSGTFNTDTRYLIKL